MPEKIEGALTLGEALAEAITLRKEVRRLRGIISRNKESFLATQKRAKVAESRVAELEEQLREAQKGPFVKMMDAFNNL